MLMQLKFFAVDTTSMETSILLDFLSETCTKLTLPRLVQGLFTLSEGDVVK